MILNAEEIRRLCHKCPISRPLSLLENYDECNFKNNPAKVELRLGKHCYCSNEMSSIIDLSAKNEVTIPPNEILFFETYEKVNMPENLSGRVGLKMSLVSKGLLMPSPAPVDPGYCNHLFGMLYNLSSKDITLSYKQCITTLEFLEIKPSRSTKYEGTMAHVTFESFIKIRITSSLGELSNNVKKAQEQLNDGQKKLDNNIRFWENILTIITVVIAILSVIVGSLSYISARSKDASIALLEDKVSRLEERVYAQSKPFDEYEFHYAPWSTTPYR